MPDCCRPTTGWRSGLTYSNTIRRNLGGFDKSDLLPHTSDTRRSLLPNIVWNRESLSIALSGGSSVWDWCGACSDVAGTKVDTWRTRYWRKTRAFYVTFSGAYMPVGFSRWRCARMNVLWFFVEFALSAMTTHQGRSHQSRSAYRGVSLTGARAHPWETTSDGE